MATIDDLQNDGSIRAVSEETDTPGGMVQTARFVITIPRDLLDTIAGGTTRSQVLVRAWLIPAIEAQD